jgi:hypothetical protein
MPDMTDQLHILETATPERIVATFNEWGKIAGSFDPKRQYSAEIVFQRVGAVVMVHNWVRQTDGAYFNDVQISLKEIYDWAKRCINCGWDIFSIIDKW